MVPLSRTERTLAWAGLALKLLLSAAALYQLQSGPFGQVAILDEATYLDWAAQLAHGSWLGGGYFAQDPLYPYFLSLLFQLGAGMLVMRVVNAAFAVGALVLLFRLVRATLGNRAALAAGAAFVLWGSLLLDEVSVGKEPLVLFLTLAALLAAHHAFATPRAPALLGAGACYGLLTLTRGNFLVLALPLAAVIFWRQRRSALLWSAGVLAVVSLLSLRNLVAVGDPSPLAASGGMNLFIGNHEGANGAYQREAFLTQAPRFETEEFAAEASRRVGKPLSPREASSYWVGQVLAFWRAHPLAGLGLLLRKAWLVFSARELPNNTSVLCMRERFLPVLATARLGFGWLWPLALAGAVVWLRERRPGRWVLGVSALYALTLVITFVLERYRVPLAPAAAAGAGCFVDRLVPLAQGKHWRALAVLCAPALLAAPLVWFPGGGFLDRKAEVSQCFSLIGSALSDAGRDEEGLELLQLSVERSPENAVAAYNLGLALQRVGHLGEAEEAYARAVSADPHYAQAHFNLGLVRLALHEGADALAELKRAGEEGMSRARLAGPIGAALFESGDLAGAEEQLKAATEAPGAEPASWMLLTRVQAELRHCAALQATLERARAAGVPLEEPACRE